MKTKKRVAAIITEYFDISHAAVIVSRMVEGFMLDGHRYDSSLDVVSMYIEQCTERDVGRQLAAKHGIPVYETIEAALLCGGAVFELDGIIVIGEHGSYPANEFGQILYPRRVFFEACLNVMREAGRVVPVYSDKGFAVIREDIEWMYERIAEYRIPFMSSSVVPFARKRHSAQPPASGSPLHKLFGFAYDHPGESPERYVYHTLEMMQSVAENRAYGESGIRAVRAWEGPAAIERVLSPDWHKLYHALSGFLNLTDPGEFPHLSARPMFFDIHYADGLQAGIFHVDHTVMEFGTACQMTEESQPYCIQFGLQEKPPYSDFGRLVLAIEKFIHTSRPPHPVERSCLTAGALDACMRSLHDKQEIETSYLCMKY